MIERNPRWLLSVIVTASRDGRSPVVTSSPSDREEPVSPGALESPSRADAGTASSRRTRGESRWPLIAAIVMAIVLQVVLPERAVLHSRWLLPGLESAALLVLIVAHWSRVTWEPPTLRAIRLALTGLLSLSSGWIISLLVRGVVDGHSVTDPAALLAAVAVSWWINITVFGLLYWQFDGGGPAVRARSLTAAPDFMFAQMQSPDLFSANWRPQFVDYLYLSFTNTTAFSPHRCTTAVAESQVDHARPVNGLAGHRGVGHRPSRQHSQIEQRQVRNVLHPAPNCRTSNTQTYGHNRRCRFRLALQGTRTTAVSTSSRLSELTASADEQCTITHSNPEPAD